jgi:hypothetical protein
VTSLREELQSISALKTEVTALKASLEDTRHELEEAKRPKPHKLVQPRSYATVAQTSSNRTVITTQRTGTSKKSRPNGAKSSGPPQTKSREKVKVDGARRIWNTLPTCTTKALAATISKLAAPTELNLRFKRKTKSSSSNNKPIWWFVVHGSENDLATLEEIWNKVEDHTLWQLQNCYMSQDPPNINDPNKDNQNASTSVSNDASAAQTTQTERDTSEQANSSQSIVEHSTQNPPSNVEAETQLNSNKHGSVGPGVIDNSDSTANKVNSTSSSGDAPLACSFLDQPQHTIPVT